jgi:cyanate permease
MDSTSPRNLPALQAVFMAPVLQAFGIGSLPVLLPLLINRKFARRAYLHTPAGIICC